MILSMQCTIDYGDFFGHNKIRISNGKSEARTFSTADPGFPEQFARELIKMIHRDGVNLEDEQRKPNG